MPRAAAASCMRALATLLTVGCAVCTLPPSPKLWHWALPCALAGGGFHLLLLAVFGVLSELAMLPLNIISIPQSRDLQEPVAHYVLPRPAHLLHLLH